MRACTPSVMWEGVAHTHQGRRPEDEDMEEARSRRVTRVRTPHPGTQAQAPRPCFSTEQGHTLRRSKWAKQKPSQPSDPLLPPPRRRGLPVPREATAWPRPG